MTTNITIENGTASFMSSVMGQVNDGIQFAEVVDDTRLHLHLDCSVFLISVIQYTFNGQSFTDSSQAVEYINT